MMNDKLAELDARALAVARSLSALAVEAKVSSATMAKLRRNPALVNVRAISKLERRLTELEMAL